MTVEVVCKGIVVNVEHKLETSGVNVGGPEKKYAVDIMKAIVQRPPKAKQINCPCS